MQLTQQRECDSKDEDQDAAEQGQHKVTGGHHSQHKQSGVLLFEVFDHGLVLSGPHRATKHKSHHRSTEKHAQWVQEAEKNK